MDACKENKTFYAAFERLNAKANKMDELVSLSQLLIEKINRTAGQPIPEQPREACEKPAQQPDMIDLFNDIAFRWEKQIEQVEANLDKVVRLID